MKKILSLILAFTLCLSLCACGKSEAVKAAEEAIAGIGEVTLESAEAIKNAQKYYDILTEDEKAKVENRIVLADAMEAYEAAVAAYEAELQAAQHELLKEIYLELTQVYEILDQHGSDLYGAWRLGIHHKDKFQGSNLNGSMKYLSSELFVSYEDLLDGAAYTLITKVYGSDWDEKTEEVKQKNRDAVATGTLFYMCKNQIPAACVNTVIGAYLLNNSVADITLALDGYTEKIAQVTAEDVFDQEREQLEKFYITVTSYLDYCQNPTGSFNQSSDTLSGYRTAARDCIAALDALLNG